MNDRYSFSSFSYVLDQKEREKKRGERARQKEKSRFSNCIRIASRDILAHTDSRPLTVLLRLCLLFPLLLSPPPFLSLPRVSLPLPPPSFPFFSPSSFSSSSTSFSLPPLPLLSPSLLPLFPPPPLTGLLAETEEAAAAAAETPTLLGCRSCGTGLRVLPLEELHSPYVFPRLHVIHIYLRICGLFSFTRMVSRVYLYTLAHFYARHVRVLSRGIMYSVCVCHYTQDCFQFSAWDGSRSFLFTRLISRTDNCYDDAPQHSIDLNVRSFCERCHHRCHIVERATLKDVAG